MNYYAMVSLFNGVVVFCVGFYLLSRQRQNSLYQSFAVFSGFVGLWCIFYAFWQIQTDKNNALMYMRLAMMAVYPIPFAFLWFVFSLAGMKRKRWQSLTLVGLPMVLMLLAFTPWLVKDVVPKLNFPFWPVPGFLMHLYVGIFIFVVPFSFWVLWSAYQKAEGVYKWQIRWVALTMFPGWIGGASNWCLWYGIPIRPIPHFFIGIAFLMLSYAVVRARLFDIEAITDLVQEAKLSALGIMATSINHEVKNPLFIIKGLAEGHLEKIVENAYGNKEDLITRSREVLQETIRQAERALEIIRNFSEYAKRQSSKTFEKKLLDVREILESIVPFVRSELVLDNIRLDLNVPPKTVVCADRQSLEEIFLNLIVNACQAMKGGGDLRIFVRKEDPWVIIEVKDTGPGLPQGQLDRIFEPFYTTKSSGTGLGLYVVKQLVEKNGGRVEVVSKEGWGTAFSVALLF